MSRFFSTFKHVLVGKPLASSELGHQRLGKLVGLAVFSSDAVASTAFASQEILQVLVPVIGAAAIGYLLPISIVVVVLLIIVVASYRQTIFAYPGGGGSYIVSRENLGTKPALVAGASLLVDYTLNVAVSAAAGVAALTSAISGLRGHPVALSLILVALITIANLRGVKESGRLFAGPVYGYVVAMLLLVGVGLARTYFGHLGTIPEASDPEEVASAAFDRRNWVAPCRRSRSPGQVQTRRPGVIRQHVDQPIRELLPFAKSLSGSVEAYVFVISRACSTSQARIG